MIRIPEHIKAVIFDFDGLLIDSERYWDEADIVLLTKRGFHPTRELLLRRLGTGHMPTMQIFKDEFNMDESLEALSENRLEIFYDLLWKNLELMEGAKQLITDLHKKNIVLAIATGGHSPKYLLEILKKLSIDTYFTVLITASHVKRQKPHPDIFLKAAEDLQITPEDCLVFEDAPSGVRAAKAAGMIAFGVNKHEDAKQQLSEVGADAVMDTLVEVHV